MPDGPVVNSTLSDGDSKRVKELMMKLEIEVPDKYVDIISRWATDSQTPDTTNCSDELKEALNVLYKSARQAIWQTNRGGSRLPKVS